MKTERLNELNQRLKDIREEITVITIQDDLDPSPRYDPWSYSLALIILMVVIFGAVW